jgi:hypothetical protein
MFFIGKQQLYETDLNSRGFRRKDVRKVCKGRNFSPTILPLATLKEYVKFCHNLPRIYNNLGRIFWFITAWAGFLKFKAILQRIIFKH